MQTNYRRVDTGVTHNGRLRNRLVEKVSPQRRERARIIGFDDFLSLFPISTLNEYGDRVICDIRIC
jgi:hypothetical protein